MIRRLAATAAIAAAAVLTTGCAAGTGAATGPPASRIRVGLQEWKIALPGVTVRPGRVTFTVTNVGSAPHDLDVVQGHAHLGATPTLAPGAGTRLSVRVRPGPALHLTCTLPGHTEAGMATTLSVARR